jgi:sensor domain CHASE-containing protein
MLHIKEIVSPSRILFHVFFISLKKFSQMIYLEILIFDFLNLINILIISNDLRVRKKLRIKDSVQEKIKN